MTSRTTTGEFELPTLSQRRPRAPRAKKAAANWLLPILLGLSLGAGYLAASEHHCQDDAPAASAK